jgi:hypothetical protein
MSKEHESGRGGAMRHWQANTPDRKRLAGRSLRALAVKPTALVGSGVLALLLAIASGCGGADAVATTGGAETVTKTVTETVTVPGAEADESRPRGVAEFGYIRSLTPAGDGYELRFDPAWFLSGVTANTAAAEDGAVEPGEPVPNDTYVVDEGHRELTYVVPADARVTVLADSPTGTEISVSELAQLVAGENPLGQPLFEPISTGFWIVVEIDTVRSLEQQYRP